jgi:hypothetical protein
MAALRITQHRLAQVLGAARLRRLVRAGWITPVERTPSRVMFRAADVHACLRRLENGEICPADRIESARTNASAIRHGRGYVKKGRPQSPGIDAIKLDFSTVNFASFRSAEGMHHAAEL